MKTRTVELSHWESLDYNIDIDWPKVQQLLGVDHVTWLLSQPQTKCQMLVEKTINSDLTLVVEFYDDAVFTQYHLMWAK